MRKAVKVNLTKRVRTPEGLRFCPVVLDRTGRVKQNWVTYKGREECYPEGMFYLDFYEQGVRRRVAAGADFKKANILRLMRQAELNGSGSEAGESGESVTPRTTSTSSAVPTTTLPDAIKYYLEETELTKEPKTHSAYRTSLLHFAEICHKPYVQDIDRNDLIAFVAYLVEAKGHSPHTCWNNFMNVMGFLKAYGARKLLTSADYPPFVRSAPESYSREQIDALLASSTEGEKLLWRFFLATGMTEKEVKSLTWEGIDLDNGVVSVKDRQGLRTIPISAELVQTLSAWKTKTQHSANSSVFVFGVLRNYLNRLKVCARRAGLNDTQFRLDKFRSTFATWHLRDGVDPNTVRLWMGHLDKGSTMRYFPVAEPKED
jgi:integrase